MGSWEFEETSQDHYIGLLPLYQNQIWTGLKSNLQFDLKKLIEGQMVFKTSRGP